MLDRNLVRDVLLKSLETGGDFAEIFFEDTFSSAISIGGKKIDSSSSGILYGAGIRVIKDFFCSYVTTNDVSREGLLKAASRAAMAISSTKKVGEINFIDKKIPNLSKVLINPLDISKNEKIGYLEEISKHSYNLDKKIRRVDSTISDKVQNVLIANSDGLWATDKRTYSSFTLTVIADDGKNNVDFYEKKASHGGFEFIKNLDIECFSTSVVSDAIIQLTAENCPAGKMPVVVASGGGVLFHEACGHSLEASSIAKNASVFTGKMGQKIANEKVTLVDDGTIPNAWGSLNIDDEGVLTKRNTLIENGVLKSYLVDKFNGDKLGLKPTGSSRRQDYRFMPTSRMNNTYVLGGENTKEELVSSVENGLYVEKLGGGSVNPPTGDFNFTVLKARVIENGKLGKAVKGAKIIGNGAEVLMNIDMVADDFSLGSNGMCGASSGSVPVGIGQPTLRISSITVGGQK